MVHHFFNLVFRAIETMPERVGSNWGGVVFTFLAFVITEAILWRRSDMKSRWGANALIGLGVVGASWLCVFAVSFILTAYDDHQNLAGAAVRIRRDAIAKRNDLSRQLQSIAGDSAKQIFDLKTDCAVRDGVNRELEKQNRAQQSTIDGCLSQAIKMIAPTGLQITPLTHVRWPDNRIDPASIIDKYSHIYASVLSEKYVE